MRLAALILNRGKPPKGGCIAAEALRLHGKEVLDYSFAVLRHYGETVVVTEITTAIGGLEDQVLSALETMSVAAEGAPDFILLHDASRPLITHEAVQEVIWLLLQGHESVTASVPSPDPLWVGSSRVREAAILQTPEGFPFMLLLKAHEWRAQMGRTFNSGTELLTSWRGILPSLISMQASNSRIESQEVLAAAEGVLKFGQEYIKEHPTDLSGIHILVLGGSGGIGNACMEALQELGATFHAPSRQELDLKHEQCYADLGSYQAVIHAAGAYEASPEEIMQVNFFSCVNLLSCAEKQQWRGNIVFISSAASTWGRPGIPIYSASKAALNSLVESEAERLANKGIRINAVAPAKVNTRLQSIINPSVRSEAMLSARYVARIVIRYLTTSQSGRIVFLRKGFDVNENG